MKTRVWLYNDDILLPVEEWIEKYPGRLLFEYDGDITDRQIEVNGKYYHWSMYTCRTEPRDYFVREYTYLEEPQDVSNNYSDPICPVCGYRNSFETPDGEFECSQCGCTLNLDRHVIMSSKEYDMYCTNIVSLVKYHHPRILDLSKVKYPTKFGDMVKIIS